MDKTYFSIIILTICLIIYYNIYYEKFDQELSKKKLTFLHLVLYSDDIEYYNCMYNITSKYYVNFPNVKTIYYTYSNKIKTDYLLQNNILYIKGNETYIPGILDKTIKAFEYFNNEYMNYDYIIRSNISTIINFNLLNLQLQLEHIDYGGGILNNLNWLDLGSGIIDKTHFGTIYGSGTSIIFSKKAFSKLLEKKQFLRMNVIDDLSIGILFKEYIQEFNPLTFTNPNFFKFVDEKNIIDILKNKKVIFYRNRNSKRENDCKQMNKIISNLL